MHPQTLNPLALKCPRLTSLSLINPSTISDNLFVGEGENSNLITILYISRYKIALVQLKVLFILIIYL